MAIQVGDILRVATTFLWDDQHEIVNVWHLIVSSLGSLLTDEDVLASIGDELERWYEQLAGSHPNNIAGERIGGVNLTRDELLPTLDWSCTYTALGEGLPLTTTPMIQWNSATPRRGSRIYLPPITENEQNDGIIGAGNITVLLDMAADVLAGFTDAVTGVTFDRVSYSRQAGTTRPLVTAFVPNELRTQRRRRRGVGS